MEIIDKDIAAIENKQIEAYQLIIQKYEIELLEKALDDYIPKSQTLLHWKLLSILGNNKTKIKIAIKALDKNQ